MQNKNENQLYQWKQKESTEQKKDQAIPTYTERADMLVKGQYQYNDDGSMKNAKRTTKKSGYMHEVVEAVKSLDVCLSREASGSQYHETVYEDVINAYRNATIACENYLLNRNPWTAEGKARKEMVKDLYTQIQLELTQFAGLKADYFKNESKNFTGAQILSELRSSVYREEKGTSITMEESGAKLTYVIEKEGIKRNFREFEGGTPDDWQNVIKKRSGDLRAGIEYSMTHFDDIIMQSSLSKKTINTALWEAISSTYGSGSKIPTEIDAKEMLDKLIESGKKQGIKSIGSLEKAINDYTSAPKTIEENKAEIESLQKDLDSTSDEKKKAKLEKMINVEKSRLDKREKMFEHADYPYILDTLTSIQRPLRLRKGAKIDENGDLAKRNVAASRIAALLGLNSIIPECELANVEIEGEKKHGVLVDEVKGENLLALKSFNKNEKSRALLNLTSIQIFDLICGQTGRSFDNYKVQTDKRDNDRMISGINNEFSFGKLTYKDIQKGKDKGSNYLQNINVDGQWTIPAIDPLLVIKIKNIEEPSILNYILADLLSKEERECLIDRFTAVRKMIMDRLEEETKMRKKGDFSNLMIVDHADFMQRNKNVDQIFDGYLDNLVKKVQ